MAKFFGRRRLMEPKEVQYYEKNTKVRWILALVFFVIGMIALAIGVKSCTSGEPGWRTIEVTSGLPNCSSDFEFNYYIAEDEDIEDVSEGVTQVYMEATHKAYDLFYADAGAGKGGLRDINSSPNQEVTVDPALYRALEQIVASGNRQLYLAPVLVEYRRVFNAENEVLAAAYDPAQNPDIMSYISQLATLISDPSAVDVKLLGNHKVCLQVSGEYLDFAQEYSIENYLDFGWMTNAFIIDYIAGELESAGYTNGYLSSFDGFTKVLDSSGQSYTFNLYDRMGNVTNIVPATMEYVGPASLVFLRGYPMTAQDSGYYFVYSSGECVSGMIDPVDGVCKTGTDNIVGMSHKKGCAELALALAPAFIRQTLDKELLKGLTEEDIQCVWYESTTLCHTGNLNVKLTEDPDLPKYTQYRVG